MIDLTACRHILSIAEKKNDRDETFLMKESVRFKSDNTSLHFFTNPSLSNIYFFASLAEILTRSIALYALEFRGGGRIPIVRAGLTQLAKSHFMFTLGAFSGDNG